LLLLHDSVLCFVFLHLLVFLFMIRLPPISTLFPYTTLFRSSPSGCHFKFCGQPIRSLSSGKCFIQLLSFRKFNPIEGFLAFKRSLLNSSKTRSFGSSSKLLTMLLHSFIVLLSTNFPFLGKSCIILRTLKGSCTKVFLLVAFIRPSLRSFSPLKGSTIFLVCILKYILLIVRSRLNPACLGVKLALHSTLKPV